MTFATISSFLSSPLEPCVALIFVRDASFSDAVAPRQSEKSIVDDCASETKPEMFRGELSQIRSRTRKNDTIRARRTHVLSPQLFLHDCVRYVPASYTLG